MPITTSFEAQTVALVSGSQLSYGQVQAKGLGQVFMFDGQGKWLEEALCPHQDKKMFVCACVCVLDSRLQEK